MILFTLLSTYADDTQIFFADSTAEKVEEVINADLANVDKWYKQNGVKRNASKYQAMLLRKHCYSHYWRTGNAWCCRRQQNEIRDTHSKCMQKSLPADRCTQSNEKDPSNLKQESVYTLDSVTKTSLQN